MSRAGTTWMAKCLNEHPSVAVYGESTFFGRGFATPNEVGMYDASAIAALREHLLRLRFDATIGTPGPGMLKHATLDDFHDEIRRVFHDGIAPCSPAEAFCLLQDIVRRIEGKPIVIEKTPHHLNWIDRMLEVTPGARFIVMIREPYGFMLSYKHFGDKKAHGVKRDFKRRYHPFGIAMIWRAYFRTANLVLDRHRDRVHLVRFEELTKDPNGQLRDVQAFLGLEVVPELADRVPPDNTSFPDGRKPVLHGEDIFWMNRVAGRDIERYGATRLRSRHPLSIIGSTIQLPFWLVRNLIEFRKRVAGSPWQYLRRWLRPG